ncbi:MAG TPA: sigma-54 dependent transcriptional regulator [Candidatus Cloacimonadota bacterium]|nr:sigma-54 dependent transcriptional regulator [Candidatus Cloacimonadota bacterium]
MRILLIEDDKLQLDILADYLVDAGYKVTKAEDGEKGIKAFQEDTFDLVISDFRMPKMDGKQVLQQIRSINPFVSVIIVTAYSSIDDAVELMKLGAIDYIQKPFPIEELLNKVKAAKIEQESIHDKRNLEEIITTLEIPQQYIFHSKCMTELLSIVRRVANSETSVLIYGESGTGKEVIADIIHYLSGRAKNRIVKINCSAIPETLMESELFGHVKGSFTGAFADRLGRFDEANHGTLFLDEIGDLSPLIQVKLLRSLQTHSFEPVGSNKTRTVDVRIIAATNKNLEELVKSGQFREDLYYRLNVVPILLPPLRERKDDIPPLIESFLRELSPGLPKTFQHDALMKLINYDWPGNIRQLRNIVQRVVTLSRSNMIEMDELPSEIIEFKHHPSQESHNIQTLMEIEREHIIKVLKLCKGNHSEAAALLGIHRNTLSNKMKEYDITVKN